MNREMAEIHERIRQVMLAYGRDCAEAGTGIVNPDFYLLHLDQHLQHLASQRQEQEEQSQQSMLAFRRECQKTMDAQAAAQGEDLQAARAIGESFFEALKPLNLQAINVANPGQHVTDLIELVARLGESLKWDHNTQGPNHVRSSCDVCAFLAEIAPTTTTP